ncbi:MAG: phosphohistidine phosphatase [Blastocatellia bacterium]|jgi:phosphohistidine phosphatase|nr:phosphohistidine phosphatase [Blastocatellia bacterium]
MKTLFLLRHAKSSWGNASLPDFERPLNERGQQAAPLIGKAMRRRQLNPQLILCSPAQRARETIALVREAAALTAELRFDRRIYEASLQTLLAIVAQLDESADAALLVGHNPGFEELLAALTGAAERMPTAALAHITLNIERWTDAREQSGALVQLLKPKELAGG